MRIAVYYAPAADDPLWQAGTAWLGRDPESGETLAQPPLADLAAITADPRRYGFHATLKPPMRLADWVAFDDVKEAATRLADAVAPFDLPPLAVANPHGFLALRETVPSPALQALADLCVAGLDHLRAPPDATELARRGMGLSPAQASMLARWGYPYVFGHWFFHMTLTHRLDAAGQARVRPAAEAHFAAALALPRRVDAIALFTEAAPGAPFSLAARLPLRG
jgi:putative phosphonate metabolism protein